MVIFCRLIGRLFTIFFCYYFLLVPAYHGIHPSSASSLADDVCKNTTNYTFCEQAIFSDSRAPAADRYVLAYISFGLAYVNATDTRDYIAFLLENNGSSTHMTCSRSRSLGLKKCRGYYDDAVRALSQVLNDLNSETFSNLSQCARDTDSAARQCEDHFVAGCSPLSEMNQNLRRLSEICLVVSALYQVW